MGTTAPLSDCRVLVLEDELMIALDLCAILEGLGCTPVGPAGGVEEALALLDKEPADLAMIDENLAGTSAAPVAASLKRRGIPYVIISGYRRALSKDPVVRDAPRLGKPFTLATIEKMLHRLNESRVTSEADRGRTAGDS